MIKKLVPRVIKEHQNEINRFRIVSSDHTHSSTHFQHIGSTQYLTGSGRTHLFFEQALLKRTFCPCCIVWVLPKVLHRRPHWYCLHPHMPYSTWYLLEKVVERLLYGRGLPLDRQPKRDPLLQKPALEEHLEHERWSNWLPREWEAITE